MGFKENIIKIAKDELNKIEGNILSLRDKGEYTDKKFYEVLERSEKVRKELEVNMPDLLKEFKGENLSNLRWIISKYCNQRIHGKSHNKAVNVIKKTFGYRKAMDIKPFEKTEKK